VLARIVAEEIEDAFILHEPGDEVECRLAILYAEIALGVGALEFERIVGEAEIVEDRGDDFGGRFLLKNLAIGGARQKPQPGHERGAVRARMADRYAAADKLTDNAIVNAGLGVLDLHLPRDVFSDDFLGCDVLVVRRHRELILEQSRHAFRAGKRAQQQHILSEGRRHRQDAVFLGASHGFS
jgi:hypothetical protein